SGARCLPICRRPGSLVRDGRGCRQEVDQATKRVERSAKQIGQGQVGLGFREMFAGIGHTLVEGAKFSGENVMVTRAARYLAARTDDREWSSTTVRRHGSAPGSSDCHGS